LADSLEALKQEQKVVELMLDSARDAQSDMEATILALEASLPPTQEVLNLNNTSNLFDSERIKM